MSGACTAFGEGRMPMEREASKASAEQSAPEEGFLHAVDDGRLLSHAREGAGPQEQRRRKA